MSGVSRRAACPRDRQHRHGHQQRRLSHRIQQSAGHAQLGGTNRAHRHRPSHTPRNPDSYPGLRPVKSSFKLLAQVTLLLLIATAFSLISNYLRPQRLPWRGAWSKHVEHRAWQAGLRLVGPVTVRQAIETGSPKLLDARPTADFRAGHIPQAQSLPFELATEILAAMQIDLRRDQTIITYCAQSDCDEGLELALLLRRIGFTDVMLFAGGLADWRAADGCVEIAP
ncbi:MAG: rhodanese-like domain-containing protein [Verrucomicrobia bacterium]|nr:MAG: rhodanese-like domain-containing protein [Verrucomicrobiota bacterium]